MGAGPTAAGVAADDVEALQRGSGVRLGFSDLTDDLRDADRFAPIAW
jgi:hypothetical protein